MVFWGSPVPMNSESEERDSIGWTILSILTRSPNQKTLIHSMNNTFTYIWHELMVNVGKYSIHGSIWGILLRIQVYSRQGIRHSNIFFKDGIGTLNPIHPGRVWIFIIS